jgi:hypothetical protein
MVKEGYRSSRTPSLWLNGRTQRSGGGGFLFFDAQTGSVSLSSSARSVYVNSSDQLVFWNGTTTTTLGSSGSVVSFTLDDAYDDKLAVVEKSSLIDLELPKGTTGRKGYTHRERLSEKTRLNNGMRQSELCYN